MKKIFTLIAAMLLSANLFAAEEVKLLEWKTYEIAGAWGGTWSGTDKPEQDWMAYDYIWFKYSGLAGAVQFGITYSEWVANHDGWTEFRGSSVPCVDASGVVGIKLDKTTKYEKGNAETNGQYVGDFYAQHVREIWVQATKDNSAVTIEGIWVGSEAEFLAATGYNADANHALQVSNGDAGTNGWDRQAIVTLNSSMEKGKTYVVEATILSAGGDCQLVPIFSTSENRDSYGGSADVQYEATGTLEANKATKLTWEFEAQFPIDKLQFFVGKIGGDLFFDNVSCKDGATEMINNGDFEDADISNWAVITYTGQTMKLVEKELGEVVTGIKDVKNVENATAVRYNLAGQKVGADYKGVVIENGRKVVIK